MEEDNHCKLKTKRRLILKQTHKKAEKEKKIFQRRQRKMLQQKLVLIDIRKNLAAVMVPSRSWIVMETEMR